jgi:hypothetical protein
MPAPRLQLQLTTPYQNVCSIVKDQALFTQAASESL